jgi:anaerobic magnesium-protoporphyrin IX monomethyl ester cyclase
MNEILFGQSYHLKFDPKLWRAMQPYPPLGSMYAASYIRQMGYDVALFDAMLAESPREWAQALERHTPRFAVLFEDNFNYLSKMCLLRMRHTAFEMIAEARRRGCLVIVSGSDATDHAAEYLAQGADFVLIGEGEISLGELLERLTGRTDVPLELIPGLAFSNQIRGANESFNLTPPRADIQNLDVLPFPAWDLVEVDRYRQIWLARHGYFSLNIATTRGCPFHCNWCAKPIWGQRYHSRSPENVVAEIAWLVEAYHPDHLWIVDDIFGLKPGWVRRFADLMQEKGIRIPFKCLNRVDLLLREGEIDALSRAGCHTAWVGAESGSQIVLDAMDKGTRVEQIYTAAHSLRQAGIRVGFFLQFGFPGETRQEIEQTLKMVRQARPDDIGMSVSYPLPGTRFHAAVKAQLGEQQNWNDSDDLAMLYRGPFTTAFYRQLHTALHQEFRLRRIGWQLTGRMTHPRNPIRHRFRSKAFGLKSIAAAVYYTLALPWSHLKLGRLAHQPYQGLRSLLHLAHPDDSALPTPQPED